MIDGCWYFRMCYPIRTSSCRFEGLFPRCHRKLLGIPTCQCASWSDWNLSLTISGGVPCCLARRMCNLGHLPVSCFASISISRNTVVCDLEIRIIDRDFCPIHWALLGMSIKTVGLWPGLWVSLCVAGTLGTRMKGWYQTWVYATT